MSIPNPLLKFVESELTEGVFNAETKFGKVSLVGSDDGSALKL